MQEMQVQSLGQEDSLEEEMATHSSILAWEIPRTEEPWWAIVHWVAKNPTGLKDYTLTYFCQKTNSVADARGKSALYLPREGLTTVPLSSVPPGPCGRRVGCP